MTKLEITPETNERGLILHVSGPLSIGHVDSFKQRLDEAFRRADPRIIVDLADCPYMDTAGIASLVAALKHARQAGRGFFLVGLGPHVENVLQLTRLAKVFDIRRTVQEALEARRSPRVAISVPLRVSWTSPEGRQIEELAPTEALNAQGARMRLKGPVPLGAKISLVNLDNLESAHARIVWAGEHSLRDGQRVGIEFLTSRAAFWGSAYTP